jgi:cytochrome c peroxidase
MADFSIRNRISNFLFEGLATSAGRRRMCAVLHRGGAPSCPFTRAMVLAAASALIVACGPILSADHALAAAKLGPTVMRSSVEAGAQSQSKKSLEQMKSEYVRPTEIPFPPDNPYTPAKADLGKMLYFDPRISNSGSQSCASCHNPALNWGDGLAKGVGSGMNQLGRRSPTILNAAWGSIFMWDGRLPDLERQALGPIQSPGEMNMQLDALMQRLKAIPGYTKLFEGVFPGEGMRPETLGRAIATYERTIVSPDAPFDKWIAGDEKAISASAKNGFVLFNTKAGCSGCHSGYAELQISTRARNALGTCACGACRGRDDQPKGSSVLERTGDRQEGRAHPLQQ